MTNPAEVEQYNYSTFVGSEGFLSFRTALHVSSMAPDFTATLLDDNKTLKLSDYWRARDAGRTDHIR